METNYQDWDMEEEDTSRYIGPMTLAKIKADIEAGRVVTDEYEQIDVGAEPVAQPKPQGEFERLMSLIESEIANADGGYWIERGQWLTILQRESRDPSRRNNGGEYDYYITFRPDGFGVEVWESWSCDFANRDGRDEHYDCIVSLDGLVRMAKLAQVTVAAKAWLAKKPGCMNRLKEAIKALGDEQ